jgi:hypothetical protein
VRFSFRPVLCLVALNLGACGERRASSTHDSAAFPAPASAAPTARSSAGTAISASATPAASALLAAASTQAGAEASPPPGLRVSELRAAKPNDGEEVAVRGYYLFAHSLSIEDPPGGNVPRAQLDDWTMEISDDHSRDDIALCHLPKAPPVRFGTMVTVRGKIHAGVLMSPCTVDPV